MNRDPYIWNEIMTIDGVRAWLTTQPADAVVGKRASCGRCPLAEYLRSKTQASFVEVGAETYAPHGWQGTWYPLPHWAQRFIVRIDALNQPFHGPVTAGEALRVLDEVTQ